ncbi:SE1561 family protein [Halobacillus naozhouensis]|uniref:SE1561 family protein n=1 Tax=Halobacillus naozhouensis TaxID=554880 RepID=A0ABY8J179_9BACI|nr:SE1561 family protein [Halobacillus naozhouensis]WFT74525.1 SE1561 family protein [Halobacillus naozhouensis]
MGKAAETQSEQFRYVKNRIQMLHQVVETMDPEQMEHEDYLRVLDMVEQLQLKMQRFKKDWEE